jgi:Flp pilus assembly protein TadG
MSTETAVCRALRHFVAGSVLASPPKPDGASAVEFAIIAPVFILMIVGMLAYGIYFGAANSVQQIAADAARTSIAGLNADRAQHARYVLH